MKRIAKILINKQVAGTLTHDDSEYIFQYTDDYYNDSTKPSISLTLPKTAQEYKSSILFPFFFNMLSEGINRQLQCRRFQIDEKDNFGLLLATAQYDTIGAVTLVAINK